jgi:hypothetical protein
MQPSQRARISGPIVIPHASKYGIHVALVEPDTKIARAKVLYSACNTHPVTRANNAVVRHQAGLLANVAPMLDLILQHILNHGAVRRRQVSRRGSGVADALCIEDGSLSF